MPLTRYSMNWVGNAQPGNIPNTRHRLWEFLLHHCSSLPPLPPLWWPMDIARTSIIAPSRWNTYPHHWAPRDCPAPSTQPLGPGIKARQSCSMTVCSQLDYLLIHWRSSIKSLLTGKLGFENHGLPTVWPKLILLGFFLLCFTHWKQTAMRDIVKEVEISLTFHFSVCLLLKLDFISAKYVCFFPLQLSACLFSLTLFSVSCWDQVLCQSALSCNSFLQTEDKHRFWHTYTQIINPAGVHLL